MACLLGAERAARSTTRRTLLDPDCSGAYRARRNHRPALAWICNRKQNKEALIVAEESVQIALRLLGHLRGRNEVAEWAIEPLEAVRLELWDSRRELAWTPSLPRCVPSTLEFVVQRLSRVDDRTAVLAREAVLVALEWLEEDGIAWAAHNRAKEPVAA